ncbi:hypothetical protein M422DRAFT_260722 [Sphaerobolus stellatus SS14]|uniref:Uncharacterized protein n=1 Tax=Sphaerobolus stellatus (strain SS14) TaxID=990650 RepID=A0A0C9VH26_SPHS4|nr:hypothetical protein M422DRAFT_260722 [Sphaerobolus stellatus SS14]
MHPHPDTQDARLSFLYGSDDLHDEFTAAALQRASTMGFTVASLQDCSNILGALSSTAPLTTILSIGATMHHYDAIPTAKYRSRRLVRWDPGTNDDLWRDMMVAK